MYYKYPLSICGLYFHPIYGVFDEQKFLIFMRPIVPLFFIVNAFNVLFNELFLVLKPEKVSPRFFSESLTVLSFTLVILCVIQHYLLSSSSFVLLISIIKFQYMYHFVSFFLSQLSLCPNTFCSHSIYATFYTVSLFYVILFFISPYCFVTIMFMLIQNFAGFLFMHSILLIS